MTFPLKIVAACIGVTLFAYIIELVRRRKLREEYAWVWLVTGMMIVTLSLWYDLLVLVGNLLGGILPSAALFFFGMLFLLFISLHQSIKISKLTDDIKKLSQELAIYQARENKRKGSC